MLLEGPEYCSWWQKCEREGKVLLIDTGVLMRVVKPSGSIQPLRVALQQQSMVVPLLSSSRSKLPLGFLMLGLGDWVLWVCWWSVCLGFFFIFELSLSIQWKSMFCEAAFPLSSR